MKKERGPLPQPTLMLLTPHGECLPVLQGSSRLHGGAFPLLVVKVGCTCVSVGSEYLGSCLALY